MPERIILKGRRKDLEPLITHLLGIHQLIAERDVGEFCGYPLDEYVRAKPQSFRLCLLYYSVPAPPWRAPSSSRLVKATYYIPFVKKTKIDWTTIKAACGGSNGYDWGRFCCTTNVQDEAGNIRQMQIYGASENEAEKRTDAFLTLTDAKIVTQSTKEEKKKGKRATDKALYKETTRVYPAYFTIIHQEKIVTESNGFPTLSGNYNRKKARVPLWTSTEPSDAAEIIHEALKVTGVSNQ